MPVNRETDAARAKTYGKLTISGGASGPVPIPSTAMVNRAAIFIFNNNASGGATLYIGYDLNLTTANGIPIPPQTGWSEDIWSGPPASSPFAVLPLNVYGVTTASNTVDVRFTESGIP